MWIEIVLLAVIGVLLALLMFGRKGPEELAKLKKEKAALERELRLRSIKISEARESKETAEEAALYEFARDMESLRSAIAGSKISQRTLRRKYGVPPSPMLFAAILKRSKLGDEMKARLSDEILVGEVGRSMMKSLISGSTIEKAAEEAGVPLIIAKGQITRLQVLGYLDTALRPTDIGRRAIG
ncbi:MAG: hypothetical protein AB1476_06035 [Candidatus Hadarchaeota archaeon]